jgi:hypothetical protein
VKIKLLLGSALVLVLQAAIAQSVTLSSSSLPIVVINTGGQAILDEPKITANMGIIYNGPGLTNNITDPFNHYNGKIGIERRGSSSQMFPKTQYSIELRTAAGADVNQSLLGLPPEEDWILFAPYNDKTLMRDVLAYKIAREMDQYASRSRFCEVIIDNDYKGVYVLLEKIKRDPYRVDIADLDPDENAGDELTGGYILKIDKTSGGSGSAGFTSLVLPPGRTGNQTIYFQYEYPAGDEITAEQKKYIGDFMHAFEASMRGANWFDPVTGYRRYINVPSFIDFFLMNELTKNPDGYRLSTFMHKEKDSHGGKLHMGPVWDFNLGFGNVNYCTNWQTSGFAKDFNTICPADNWLIPFWWSFMWNDPAFRGPLYTRWTALRSGPLQVSKVFEYIDSVANVLTASGAQQRNFQRWPVLGKYVWPNPPAYSLLTTYDFEVNWLKTWVAERFAWLDQNLAYVVSGTDDQPGDAVLSVRAFPNPFYETVNFEYSLPRPSSVSIEIYDVLGRTISHTNQVHTNPGVYSSSTDTASLPDGMYIYQVTIDGIAVNRARISKGR